MGPATRMDQVLSDTTARYPLGPAALSLRPGPYIFRIMGCWAARSSQVAACPCACRS